MQRIDGRFVYSASDLNDYLECKRLTELEGLVARHKLERPEVEDLQGDLIRRKGDEHEQRHLEMLRERHAEGVVAFERAASGAEGYREAERQTLEAMRDGAPIIYQATFFDGQFLGHADFLRRVDGAPSELGDYSYEVIDTKLGLSTRPYYIVQICNYSEHLERLQGCAPAYGYVVLGDGAEERFRLHDYAAYYRHLKASFLSFVGSAAFEEMSQPSVYALACKHCGVCPWNDACTQQRTDDDHLSLVAWMRRDQIAKFEAAEITSVAQLAAAPDGRRPNGMTEETFTKLRRQASLQVRGRSSGDPLYELLQPVPPLGFELLPHPAAGDVFFDMEGDPLYEPGRGLEYLFGAWMPDDEPHFRAFWGTDRAGERQAFEAFVDFVVERRRRYPALHVYHYAAYEKSALRRLAQAHCTREKEVDDLLRSEVLVDLFAVVRQTLAISEDGYGLKKIERFYGVARGTEVKKGDESIVMFERWMAEGDPRILADIEAYNRDDCHSTFQLREWLLARRAEAIERFGIALPLREPKRPDEPCHERFEEACPKCVQRRKEQREDEQRTGLERTLLDGLLPPCTEDEYRSMTPAKRERYLLGNLLAYHRREERSAWWEYFDRCDNVDRLFEFDKTAIGCLKLREDVPVGKEAKSKLYTYAFPAQSHKLGAGELVVDPRARKGIGSIFRLDDEAGSLVLKTTALPERARAIEELIPGSPPRTIVQREALARIGDAFVRGTLAREYPATYDMLASANPRAATAVLQPERVSPEAVAAVVRSLRDSYLFIQGPPGSGKTTVGAHVICDLLARGKRVAVTSTSHKAIQNLLHKVECRAAESGVTFRGRYKHSSSESAFVSRLSTALIESYDKNEDFDGDDYQLAGGTSWLCARDTLAAKFDYLFIDEAGQVALADALAVSLCAKNVVLLGDPSQLAQVSQGTQPLHVGDSVLQHLLGDRQTVPEDRGIFLDVSYRMQPQICSFVSDAMYEGRLEPASGTSAHRVILESEELAGLFFAPIAHEGNGSSSVEEADEIVRRVAQLLAHGRVVDSQPPQTAGVARPLTDRDIIVVTPYNAQRRLVTGKLRAEKLAVEVGTVDKFQGQEAPVVFYSMATSSGADVPRDVEFLFDRNRFNVAISRGRAASILVCSPRLLDIPCRTPDEMALVNLLCAFAEAARRAAPSERAA